MLAEKRAWRLALEKLLSVYDCGSPVEFDAGLTFPDPEEFSEALTARAAIRFLSGSHFGRLRGRGATMADDQNVSGLRGGNEGQTCVLLRPVPAPSLHADMARLAPALLACLRPVNAGEACDRLGGVRNNADGPVWTQRNEDRGIKLALCHGTLVRKIEAGDGLSR